ncbi:MAG: ABC transporter ATP-binding protein, partial [Nocardioides sp.]
PGSSLALVGRSGAGKSSLAHLLLRLWDPTRGRILLDGEPLSGLCQRDVPTIVGLVPQEVYLFAISLRENIRLARPEATDADIDLVCQRALVDEFAGDLPDGLDTVLPERGASLSGGQRQRIAVARALLTDPGVLILDEASATLDATSEALLSAAIEEVRAGRTTVVIAHRLSTLRHADRVVVIDDGRILQDGDLAGLLAEPGLFRELMAPQLEATGP